MLGAWLVGLSDKIPVPEPFISWVYCLKITLSHRLWFARNSQEEPASHRSVYLLHTHTFCTTETTTWSRTQIGTM